MWAPFRGERGIRALGAGNVGSTITNSGKIAGTGGTAIKLMPAADTLTLLPGSQIIGAIDMGGGADTINIVNNVPVISRVSSFFRLLSANFLNIINFTGPPQHNCRHRQYRRDAGGADGGWYRHARSHGVRSG